MTEIEPTCSNCRFSVETADKLKVECHKNAPKPLVVNERIEAWGDYGVRWPLLDLNDFCFEHPLLNQ